MTREAASALPTVSRSCGRARWGAVLLTEAKDDQDWRKAAERPTADSVRYPAPAVHAAAAPAHGRPLLTAAPMLRASGGRCRFGGGGHRPAGHSDTGRGTPVRSASFAHDRGSRVGGPRASPSLQESGRELGAGWPHADTLRPAAGWTARARCHGLTGWRVLSEPSPWLSPRSHRTPRGRSNGRAPR
jgi:hypothetical protein